MTSKENCPNELIFVTYGSGVVFSRKKEINHMSKGFDKELIDNLCPECTSNLICTYKTELLDNLDRASKIQNAIMRTL